MKTKEELERLAEAYEQDVRPKNAAYYSANETRRDFLAGYEARGVEEWNAAIESGDAPEEDK